MEPEWDRIFINPTTYSQNMEKHAAPQQLSGYYPQPFTHITKYNIGHPSQVKKPWFLDALHDLARHEQDVYDPLGTSTSGRLPKLLIKPLDPELIKLVARQPQNQKGDVSRWLHTLDGIKIADIRQCNCLHTYGKNNNINKILAEKILGTANNDTGDVMGYGSCKHCMLAAAKRQIKAAPTPDPKMLQDFIKFAKQTIDKEVGPYLTDFGYSYNQWYNHLTKAKQQRMDLVHDFLAAIPNPNLTPEVVKKIIAMEYEGICKIELQPPDGKPRMVCAIPDLIKYVMGPITWKLEEIFSTYLRGYCGGKNLDEMTDMVNKFIDLGFTKVVEGDGSAFDNTQDVNLKEIDRYIYRKVADSVYHVPKDLFMHVSQAYYKTMKIMYQEGKKQVPLMTYAVLGTVFSGDCDTTLMNTTRMALYNRYTFERAGYKYMYDYVAYSKGDDFTVHTKSTMPDDVIRDLYHQTFLPPSPTPDIVDTRQYGLGQVDKFLNIGGPEIISFCSLRAWTIDDTTGHIFLTRDPKKFSTLSKYSRKIKMLKNEKYVQYLLDQEYALYSTYRGIKYFDTMAKMYHKAALKAMSKLKITHAQMKEHARKRRGINKELARNTLPLEEHYMSEFEIMLYNVSPRIQFYKINGTYWETQKRLFYNTSTARLTQQQIDNINQHVSAEFSCEELESELENI